MTNVELGSFQSKCNILLKEITDWTFGPLLNSLFACHCISAKHKKAIENKSLDRVRKPVNTDRLRKPVTTDRVREPVNTDRVRKPVDTDRLREFFNTDSDRELVDTDGVRELLRILRRRSFSQFQLFLSCLVSTNQQHVRDVLQSPGGI